MDISMDIHVKSVNMDIVMDVKFHMHINRNNFTLGEIKHILFGLKTYIETMKSVTYCVNIPSRFREISENC